MLPTTGVNHEDDGDGDGVREEELSWTGEGSASLVSTTPAAESADAAREWSFPVISRFHEAPVNWTASSSPGDNGLLVLMLGGYCHHHHDHHATIMFIMVTCTKAIQLTVTTHSQWRVTVKT
jgi:hypothetical protein